MWRVALDRGLTRRCGPLQALTEAEGDDTEYTVEELMDMANQMVEETTNNFPKEGDDAGALDKGAWYSFHVFPVADAHA